MKYIVKIPPVSFYFLMWLLGNFVSVKAFHFIFLWIRLHQTINFLGGGDWAASSQFILLEMVLWTASHFHCLSLLALLQNSLKSGFCFHPLQCILSKSILNYYSRCFTICNLQFSLNRPLYLTEHCCPQSWKPLSFQGPCYHTLLIVCLLLMFLLSLCAFISIPALRGVGCFFCR